MGCDQAPLKIYSKSGSSHQAIDGYIVNAEVRCDGLRNGLTGKAGRFNCPRGTTLMTIRGGSDVGFDDDTLFGGTPFIGELQAPGISPFVTPMTSLAVKIASTGQEFTLERYEEAGDLILNALDLADLSLDMDPVENLDLVKANAQINQLVTQFSSTTDEYTVVMDELANVLVNGEPVDLNTDTSSVVSMLNENLATTAPELTLTPTEETETVSELTSTNTEIEDSTSLEEIDTVVIETMQEAAFAFAIDYTAPFVRYSLDNNYAYELYSLRDFEDPELYWETHRVSFRDSWNEHVDISTSALTISETLTDATVNLGIEFKSTTDSRQLSVTLSGARLSMTEGNSQSVDIVVPTGTLINARGIDTSGVVTDVSTLSEEDQFASSDDGIFRFSLYDVNRRLRSNGHPPLLDSIGNYQMTVVISGIRFNISKNDDLIPADEYTISNGTESITGHGLRGYVSRTYWH